MNGMRFTKMHGLGNDFMVIDAIQQQIQLSPAQIVALAHRQRGVGFDQCLLVERSNEVGVDFTYRIYNADGQEVGQCGNGARCLARFAHHYGLTSKRTITVATKTTRMELHINADETVSVVMDVPKLNPKDIPFHAPKQAAEYLLPVANQNPITIHAISVGNPHAVIVVDELDTAPVAALGGVISQHPHFPEQTNVGFMQLLNPQHIALRVFERGCGETQACGSGAVAAAAIGRLFHALSETITVSLPGGDLLVHWPTVHEKITLTGPAVFVYEGSLLLA